MPGKLFSNNIYNTYTIVTIGHCLVTVDKQYIEPNHAHTDSTFVGMVQENPRQQENPGWIEEWGEEKKRKRRVGKGAANISTQY